MSSGLGLAVRPLLSQRLPDSRQGGGRKDFQRFGRLKKCQVIPHSRLESRYYFISIVSIRKSILLTFWSKLTKWNAKWEYIFDGKDSRNNFFSLKKNLGCDYDIAFIALCQAEDGKRTESEPSTLSIITLPEKVRNLRLDNSAPTSLTIKWDAPVVSTSHKYKVSISGSTPALEDDEQDSEWVASTTEIAGSTFNLADQVTILQTIQRTFHFVIFFLLTFRGMV